METDTAASSIKCHGEDEDSETFSESKRAPRRPSTTSRNKCEFGVKPSDNDENPSRRDVIHSGGHQEGKQPRREDRRVNLSPWVVLLTTAAATSRVLDGDWKMPREYPFWGGLSSLTMDFGFSSSSPFLLLELCVVFFLLVAVSAAVTGEKPTTMAMMKRRSPDETKTSLSTKTTNAVTLNAKHHHRMSLPLPDDDDDDDRGWRIV